MGESDRTWDKPRPRAWVGKPEARVVRGSAGQVALRRGCAWRRAAGGESIHSTLSSVGPSHSTAVLLAPPRPGTVPGPGGVN